MESRQTVREQGRKQHGHKVCGQLARDRHGEQRRMAQPYVGRGGGAKNLLLITFLCALVCVHSATQIQTCGECTFWKDANGMLSKTGSCESGCSTVTWATNRLYLDSKGIVSIANGTFDGMPKMERLLLHNNALTALPADAFKYKYGVGRSRPVQQRPNQPPGGRFQEQYGIVEAPTGQQCPHQPAGGRVQVQYGIEVAQTGQQCPHKPPGGRFQEQYGVGRSLPVQKCPHGPPGGRVQVQCEVEISQSGK